MNGDAAGSKQSKAPGTIPPHDGGEKVFRAIEKKTGAIILERPLPSGVTGVPLTWMVNDRQYGVVATGAQGIPVELVASAMAQVRCHESAVLRPFRFVAARIPILEDIA